VDKLSEVIYTPESQLRNPVKLLGEMIAGLKASRELAWRLFVRDISAQYRQTALGYAWVLIPPLATTAVWVFLNSQKILNMGQTDLPYPVYVLTGSLLWQTFVFAISNPVRVVSMNRGMLAKVNFPREALLVAAVGQTVFSVTIQMVLLVPVFILFHVSLGPAMLLAPLGILVLVGLGTAIGVLLVPIGTLYRDVERGIPILMRFWFFLTPIVYPPPTNGLASLLVGANPVSAILVTTRNWLTGQGAEGLAPFAAVSAAAAVLLVVGLTVYRVAMPHMIARMDA